MRYLKEFEVIDIQPGHTINITGTHSVLTISEHNTEYIGLYVVTHTAMDGGGTGHGPHDVYPDGYHVFCENILNPDIRIDFYQSGSFISMIERIDPIGKAKRTWELINE